ncbi:MAG: cyclic nucleotide-binding domain-containing protein [Thermodesulfobacteriota bacterium]|nr:cyclic nucleotide-binding domain-containing protein [Thermodesulfobacteriota bacterium]
MNRREMEYALESCEFFELLGKNEISEIASLCQVNTYKTSEYVFQQGDHGEHLYIIAQGHIYLERSMDLGKHKGNIVIEALGKGRVLGCWSTLLDIPHSLMSSAICQKPTTVLAIKGSDLRQIMIGNTKLGFKIMERLCFLLRDRIQAAYGAMEKI